MKHNIRERTMALAGLFQAVSQVKQIANDGAANNAVMEASLETLFKFDSNSVEDVYGGVADIITGIKTLKQQFDTEKNQRDMELTGYAVSVLLLERKLSRNKTMLDAIGKRLEDIRDQFEYFSLTHENTIHKLGELYRETISTLGPKIIVRGEQPYLSNNYNASKVRALLLAAIRSAVLWRQCGGSRWQILFGRKKYLAQCELMLTEVNPAA